MAFDTQTVTIKGAELLAAATAQDKLIIVGCDVTQTYMTQAQAVNISARPANPFSNTTTVTQVGSNSNHINSRVYFRAGENTGGDANTLFLYAHKQSDPTNDFVIFVASAETPFHLPVIGDVVDEWETALDIVYNINADAVGYAEQSTYCTLSEFNLLKERTVTTHKEGEPTQGDNQTIYGDKTFNGSVTCADWLTARTGMVSYLDIDIECEEEKHGIKFILPELPEATIMADEADGGTIYIDVPITEFGEKIVVGGKTNGLFCTYAVNDNRASALIEFENTPTVSPQIYLSEATTNSSRDDYLSLTVSEIEISAESILINSGGLFTQNLTVNGTSTLKGVVTIGTTGSISTNLIVHGASQTDVLAVGDAGNNGILTVHGQTNLVDVTIGSTGDTSSHLTLYGAAHIERLTVGPYGSVATNLSVNGASEFGNVTANSIVVGTSGTTATTFSVNGKSVFGNTEISASGEIAVKDSGSISRVKISDSGISLFRNSSSSSFSVLASDGSVVSSSTVTCGGVVVTGQFSGGVQSGGSISVKNSSQNTVVSISGETVSTGSVYVGNSSQNAYMHSNEIAVNNTTTGRSVNISPDGISGIAPTNTNGTTLNVPVGGIIGVYAIGEGPIGTRAVGETLTVSSNSLRTCRWDCLNGNWIADTNFYVPAGTYKTITGFYDNTPVGSQGIGGLVLLIRTA